MEDIIHSKNVLFSISAFTEEMIEEIIQRAESYLQKQNEQLLQTVLDVGVLEEIINLQKLSLKDALLLGKNKIYTLSDLADLSVYDLLDIFPHYVKNQDFLETWIMEARQSW